MVVSIGLGFLTGISTVLLRIVTWLSISIFRLIRTDEPLLPVWAQFLDEGHNAPMLSCVALQHSHVTAEYYHFIEGVDTPNDRANSEAFQVWP